MRKGRAVGLALLVVCVLGLVWRGIEVTRYLRAYEQEQEQLQHEKEREFNTIRPRLVSELEWVAGEIRQTRRVGEEGMQKARHKERVAVAAAAQAEQARKQVMRDHWLTRWFPGTDASKKIVSLGEKVENYKCTQHRARVGLDAAAREMQRQLAALEVKKSGIEQRIAALKPPQPTERSSGSWFRAFLGFGAVTLAPDAATPEQSVASNAPTAAAKDTGVPRVYSYRVPDVEVSHAPSRQTTIFEILDIRSASDVGKVFSKYGKEAQSTATRWWTDKEKGTLVDLTIGCAKTTLDKSFGEAVWRKYHYFLAQSDAQCEMSPTSTFRDVFKQIALKDQSKLGGPPVAHFLNSNHTIGMAIDEGPRCQNQPSAVIPFDFDEDGQVIFVKTVGSGNPVAKVLDDPATRVGIISKRRAEFWDDFRQVSSTGGDVQRWEADHYDAALHELLGFPSGMGIYGAHVMSFEAGLKAGLVGAYCSVRFDPLHSEKSIGGSTAECGDKLGGAPQCYRVDKQGKPDCWRGSPLWNARVEEQRRRHWGARYEALYGSNRLERYMRPAQTGGVAQR